MSNTAPTTGLSLKLSRIRRRVKVIDLAVAMNVTHGRVSQIENQATVTPVAAARYLEALATFPVVSDEPAEVLEATA